MYSAPPDGNDEDESVDGTVASEATEETDSEATEEIEAKATEPAQTDSAAEPRGDSGTDQMETVELGEASSTTDANWTGTIPADD